MTTDSLTLLLPSLVAGLLIIATHVPLGIEVMKRGIIFIDLAIAQIAGLGVIISYLYFHGEDHYGLTQLIALTFALLAAGGFKLCEKYLTEQQEAIIGTSYVVTSSLALVLLSQHPHGSETITTILSGQLLWVNWHDIALTALVYTVLLLVIYQQRVFTHWFHGVFALAITIAVQLGGIYLVFASLIIPALSITLSTPKQPLLYGYSLSILSLCTGLLLSFTYDLPTGPLLVCTLCAIFTVATVVKKRFILSIK